MAENRIIGWLIGNLEKLDNRLARKRKNEPMPKKPVNAAARDERFVQNKKLTTFVGKYLDTLGYGTIALMIVSLIIACGLFFWIYGGTNRPVSFFGGQYFSIVTFTSLGYGDIAPVGFGKLVAGFEVLAGLVLIAIGVGKLASERQSALLLLLYTSEHQRRIRDFEKQFKQQAVELDELLENHDHEQMLLRVKSYYRFLSGVNNYLILQSNQGGLATFGNVSSLRKLYRSLIELQKVALEAIQTWGTLPQVLVHLERWLMKVDKLANHMNKFHIGEPKSTALLSDIKNRTEIFKKWILQSHRPVQQYKHRSRLNEFIIKRVHGRLPQKYKVKGIPQQIAQELGLGSKLVQRAIAEIEHRQLSEEPTKKGG